jgi:hypothetical protein
LATSDWTHSRYSSRGMVRARGTGYRLRLGFAGWMPVCLA